MTQHVSSHKARKKTLQRWKELGKLGAFVYDEGTRKLVRVKTQPQGEQFFREIASDHGCGPIPPTDDDHLWLSWLIRGHYAYLEMCPSGVDYFVVQRNSDIGHKGDHLGFSVVATGAHGFARPFSFKRALLGTPKNDSEKLRVAFRHAVEDDVSEWGRRNWREGLRCPVFGTELHRGSVQIDHQIPTFEQLRNMFMDRSGETFSRDLTEERVVADVFKENRYEWDLLEPWRQRWREFHWSNMRLHFVSTEGHLLLSNFRDTFGFDNLST